VEGAMKYTIEGLLQELEDFISSMKSMLDDADRALANKNTNPDPTNRIMVVALYITLGKSYYDNFGKVMMDIKELLEIKAEEEKKRNETRGDSIDNAD
jgi:hypothetical protein